MSGTDVRSPYGMSGTDVAYAATRRGLPHAAEPRASRSELRVLTLSPTSSNPDSVNFPSLSQLASDLPRTVAQQTSDPS
eukprot:2372498-Rhodomonas_salina.4